ncbi:Zinc/iron permease [Gigaspora rosea]|uniref:Zinc/iron permease n=1 Tax=Gigaspora rosea TaxID=44941 RepID=A0A397V944_9GLOM|nr:Zinc/iron permease [Gigaspora rosea]
MMDKCVVPEQGSNLQGWLLAIASGLACCVGASAVFSNRLVPKSKANKHKQNLNLMVASFALGSGVLLYSSFFTLLNESKKNFAEANISKGRSGHYVITFYFLGVIGSILINSLIHNFVTDESFHSHHHHHHHHHNFPQNENTPLLKDPLGGQTTAVSKDDYCNLQNIGDFNEADSSEGHSIDIDESSISSDHGHHHHDLQNTHSKSDQENAKLMQIGIQTAIAISIHKFPEGLITFVSSQASRSLGFALFAAIALHNIIEGLTIALPIYIATRSRIKAFLFSSILGGFSQPLGALIGWLFLNESFFSCWNHNFIYGALFAATSGLMGVICINGMLPQAIKYDKNDGQFVTFFFFLGVFFMGISSALFDQS